MVSNSFVFPVLFFLLVIFDHETCALKKGDVGTCDGKVRTFVNKQVTYWAKGRCKNSKNICRARRKKTVPSLKWTTGTICCEGWQHDGELDACKPVCSIGCQHGTCTAPETCYCDPPLYLDPLRKYICLTPPACPEPSVNAVCVKEPTSEDKSICECLNTTRRYNATHCAEGYQIKPDLTCKPICETACFNGECIAPNKCICSNGYKFENGTCQPFCESCANSECVGPNKCKCFDGFSPVNDTHCEFESCVCENGECVSGQCSCHDGYELKDGSCEPVCELCVNGLCTSPGVCTCFEGHNASDVAGLCCRPECGPSCDENGECPMRACVLRKVVSVPGCKPTARNRCKRVESHSGWGCCNHWVINFKEDRCEPICKFGCLNGTCIAPDTCSCLPGYMEHNETSCAPACDSPCNNGACTAPNQCTCNSNHEPDPTDKFNCIPICNPPCDNASCVSPNTCACNPGYEPQNNWQCKPVCDTCRNGQCVGPNNCRCNDGYAKKDGQCAPLCAKACQNGYCLEPNVCTCQSGFKLNAVDKFVCEPACEPSCVNGKCISPNVCSCDSGYELESEWKCKPVCDSCENGKCVAPNVCSCDEGYVKRNGTCTPVCDPPCFNGHCSKPNECSCYEGFKHSSHNNFTCDPICEPECENSRCVSPNVCFCNAGYVFENKWKCKPICDSCDNGVCVAPNLCSCNKGFTLEGGRCVPVCNTPCLNGTCVAPNKCECFKDYEFNAVTSQCDPICHPGCTNSKCVEPNKCECFEGYTETMERFICLPYCESCEHGTCVEPEKCECHEGYNSLYGKCSPVCKESCQNGNCSAPNTCTCFEGFEKREGRQNVCYKTCDRPCENGFCNEYGVCECHPGFAMNNGTSCQPVEAVECDSCGGNCTENVCQCKDGGPCYASLPTSEEVTTSASLAGLEWSWMLGGAVILLLITMLLIVLQRTWARRKRFEKNMDQETAVGSVMYHTVVPDALIVSRSSRDAENQPDYYTDNEADAEAQDSLMSTKVEIEDEQL